MSIEQPEAIGLSGLNHDSCRSPVTESFYALAGRPVRLRVAGRELAKLTSRAIKHLEIVGTATPALTMDLWDCEVTGASRPTEPEGEDSARQHWDLGRGRLVSTCGNRFLGWATDHGAAWLDRERNQLSGGWVSASRLTLLERGKPLFDLINTWQRDHGIQTIHAGLVSKAGRGVLLPGVSGVGKTTSALSCIAFGFQFLGDDHVGLERKEGRWVGYSMYGSACVEPEHLERFTELRNRAADGPPPPADKRVIFLDGAAGWLAKSTEIQVIAIPRVCESERSTFQPASRGDAFRALALGTLGGVKPRPAPRDLQQLAVLVDQVPCVWLNLGSRLDDIPRCIDSLLDELVP